jgi:hypothetical protein
MPGEESSSNELPWRLKVDERGNVVLLYEELGSLMLLKLGALEPACEAMCAFLADVDFGERGRHRAL